MNIGTINCQGLNNDLKLRQVATDLEDYNLDILTLQETHLKESGQIIIESIKCKSYRLFSSGVEKNSFAGVGLLVKDNNKNCIFTPINERICYLTYENEDKKYLIINVYAHTLHVANK